jgi:hypothetical protein
MGGAEVDPVARTARVGGGALLADLDQAAQEHGLVCPVGVVSHTGAAGLTLGGGMGRLMRRFGLTIDNLLSVELVTADGRLVPVTHPLDRARELAALWRDLAENGPDELFLSFGTDNENGGTTYVTTLHSGSVAQAERDLAELRAFGPPVTDTIAPKPYLETQGLNDEPHGWGHRFYMKSAFLPALSDEAVDVCVQHATRAPDGTESSFSTWAWGRRISEVPEDATAFTGRAAAAWIAAEAMWDDPELDDRCRTWARDALADLAPFASDGRYVNDVVEVGADVARMIYGDAKYDRLVALKREWDPDNVFRLNQNIQP